MTYAVRKNADEPCCPLSHIRGLAWDPQKKKKKEQKKKKKKRGKNRTVIRLAVKSYKIPTENTEK